MKVCFFLQRSFATVGDAIAATLRDEYGVKEFCGFVQLRPSLEYLQKESDVAWSSLLLEEDVFKEHTSAELDMEYLKSLEKRIGLPNLWPYLTADRIIMSGQLLREYPYDVPLKSHEDMLRLVQVYAKNIEAFLDREKPDAALFSVVGSLGATLLYMLAKERGIRTWVIHPALFESRSMLSSRHDYAKPKEEMGDEYEKPVSEAARKKAAEFIATFRARPAPRSPEFSPDTQPVSRGKQMLFLKPARLFRNIPAFYRAFSAYYGAGIRADYSTVSPWMALWDRLKRRARNARGMADLYESPRENESYAFFPLQFEPEMTLLVQAPYMTDQIAAVRYLARSLPVGWKLYVKEHPQMVEYRTRRFYQEIKKIPNVRLIDPAYKSFGIISNAGLITVINGTVGFEACLMKKPVITLGYHFINELSFVRHCARMDELAKIVNDQIESFAFDDEELHHFIGKVIENSTIVELEKAWYGLLERAKKIEIVAPFAHFFAKKLSLSSR